MKKIWLITLTFLTVFFVTACGEKELVITAESEITMENLDLYLYRDDVQYVDLRNHQAQFKYGFIDNFELIPFFDYLDYRAFDRGRTYEFNPDQLRDTSILTRLFKPEKAILLYADGCIRSGYIKDVLNHLGYERVFVIGGYYEYLGENKIFGDGSYEIGTTFYTTHVDEITNYTYVMYGDYEVAKNILFVHFDILDESNRSVRYDEDFAYDAELTVIENHIIDNIYNFNEIVELLDDTNSDIYNLNTVNWNELSSIIELFQNEYRD